MSQDSTPVWLAWIGPLAAVAALGWAFLRRFFVTVTREELRQAIEDMDKPQERRHQENLGKFEELFERLSAVEQSNARMEGQMSGRYPRVER